MKKNRLAASALALAVSITACGCGDQIYEMTDEEETAVVQYAAHVVSKFNRKQSEGIENVAVLKALMKIREEEAEKRRKQQEEEQQQQEEEKPDQKPDTSGNQQPGTPSQGQQEQPQKTYVTLTKALQLDGVDASYRKYELTSAYQASQSYMVRANSGNELLVLHVNLKNSGNKTAECDILSKMPSFRLTINGETSVSADTTILLNDLGTYQGKIRAGKTKKAVLIFQVKKGSVKSVDSMELEVKTGGTSSQVQLEG